MIRVLIINKSYLVGNTLKQTLEKSQNIYVVEQANSTEVADQILDTLPLEIDVIILDVQLSCHQPEGMMYASFIRKQFPEIKILVFSFYKIGAYVYHMHKQGIHGFLFKESGPAEIVKAIETIHNEKLYYKGQVDVLLKRYTSYLDKSNEDDLYMSPIEIASIKNMALIQSLNIKEPDKYQRRFIKETIWKNIVYKLGTSDLGMILDIAYKNGWIVYG